MGRLGEAMSVQRVARASGLSTRTLYRLFQRAHGTSPVALRRRARLASAHADLQRPKGGTTVTLVALRWGFAHLGRFASDYARVFGESPSATLRRARRVASEPHGGVAAGVETMSTRARRKAGTAAASLVAAMLTSLVVVTPATAQGPAFDCARADGEVETLICRDAGLAALDRSLDGVYKAALAKARDGMAARLRADQRGWVSGRNECWKVRGAPTYITATWTASTVGECISSNYRLRISQLQAEWQLVTAKPPVSYVCNDSPANEIIATFVPTDPPTARLERGDRAVTTWNVAAASGAKYEGRNVEFWDKGGTVAVTWLDESLTCRPR